MAAQTLTFSDELNGWTSFFSYHPEFMIGLNNTFYTFKDGELYKHRDDTAPKNNFYGDQFNSKITTIFNDSPIDAKMFKTIGLESNSPWAADIETDFSTGQIDSTYYEKKEGDYYAYIRRDSGNQDLDLMSAQGIGEAQSVTGTAPAAVTINFAFNIDSMVSVGDIACIGTGAGVTSIGAISSITSTSIVINTPSVTPVATDFIMYLKDAIAESYGTRGYYMQIELTNTATTDVELFAVTSEVFKSYP